MNLLLAWLLGGLFACLVLRGRSAKKQSFLTYLFVVLLWPIVPVGMVLYLVLIILAGIVLVLHKAKV